MSDLATPHLFRCHEGGEWFSIDTATGVVGIRESASVAEAAGLFLRWLRRMQFPRTYLTRTDGKLVVLADATTGVLQLGEGSSSDSLTVRFWAEVRRQLDLP